MNIFINGKPVWCGTIEDVLSEFKSIPASAELRVSFPKKTRPLSNFDKFIYWLFQARVPTDSKELSISSSTDLAFFYLVYEEGDFEYTLADGLLEGVSSVCFKTSAGEVFFAKRSECISRSTAECLLSEFLKLRRRPLIFKWKRTK